MIVWGFFFSHIEREYITCIYFYIYTMLKAKANLNIILVKIPDAASRT